VSHFGAGDCSANGLAAGTPGEHWRRSAKMLALLQMTLRGTPFVYQGQEIGMTNFDFTSIGELDDVMSHGLDALMRKLHIPGFLRWKWIKAGSRDNARTPVQWDGGENAGFSVSKPWLRVNANYRHINYASQKNDPDSVLNFYKALIALRQKNECLKSGEFVPLFADTRLMAYRRTLGDEAYTVMLNFSCGKKKLPKKVAGFLAGTPVISNTGRTVLDGILLPWEGVLVKNS